MKLIVFDIDGTLLYTGGAGRIAFEKAFDELFGQKDVWRDLIPDGKTDPMIIEEILRRTLQRPLKDHEYRDLVVRYHYHFEIEIQSPPKFLVLPGVAQLLELLSHRKDCVLGIATGNFEQAAKAKLRKGNLQHYFSFGGFASDAACRTELTRIGLQRGFDLLGTIIPNEDIFLVGDTPHDIQVGKALKIPTIGVATGRTRVQEFKKKYEADYALEDLSNAQSFFEIVGLGSPVLGKI